MNLPELVGTSKQIAWAEKIRQDRMAWLEQVQKSSKNFGEFAGEIIAYLSTQTKCSDWIDHRDFGMGEIKDAKTYGIASWWTGEVAEEAALQNWEAGAESNQRKHDQLTALYGSRLDTKEELRKRYE